MAQRFRYDEWVAKMEYNHYSATIYRSQENDYYYHGKVDCIRDLICFDGNTLDEVYQMFKESIDDYIGVNNNL